MSIDHEARTTLQRFNRDYRRTVYGCDGYRERVQTVITVEREFQASQHRTLNLIAEHCSSWPINRRSES